MNLGALGEDITDYSFEYPTDPAGNALVLAPGTVTAAPATTTSTWNWTSIFQSGASVANNLITQNGLTTRQQNALNAGQVSSAGQATVFGIPILYLLIGAAVVVMVKK